MIRQKFQYPYKQPDEKNALRLLYLFTCFVAVSLGDDRLRNNAKQSHRESRDNADKHAVNNTGDNGHADHSDRARDNIGESQAEEARDNELFLAELLYELRNYRIKRRGKHCHSAEENHGKRLVKLHGNLYEEGQTRLEQCQTDPVHDIGKYKGAEAAVSEGRAERLEHIGIRRLCINKFLFLEEEGGDKHTNAGNNRQNDKADAVAPRKAYASAQHSRENKGRIGEHGSREERERDSCGDVHTVVLGFSEFRDKRVVRSAVHRHKQVEQYDEYGNPCHVPRADFFHRRAKQQNGYDRKRNRRVLHKRNTSAAFVLASVRKRSDKRVGYRVKYSR